MAQCSPPIQAVRSSLPTTISRLSILQSNHRRADLRTNRYHRRHRKGIWLVQTPRQFASILVGERPRYVSPLIIPAHYFQTIPVDIDADEWDWTAPDTPHSSERDVREDESWMRPERGDVVRSSDPFKQ